MDKKSLLEYQVRTDLAVEARELIEKPDEINGVIFDEHIDSLLEVKTTKVIIRNKHGEKIMKKPIGTYITLEADAIKTNAYDNHRAISELLATHITQLLPKKSKLSILVVGLGNRWVTPDSLGPKVVSNLLISRHLFEELGEESEIVQDMGRLSALSPGVMGQTGMETGEIVKGVIDETKPDVIIAVDALASRRTNRVNTTIQLSDTGIHPGSGVGNRRKGLTKEHLGIPVIAIGVPTVVDAATIVNDTLDSLLTVLGNNNHLESYAKTIRSFNEQEKYDLIKELLQPETAAMFVTPKDIDATIKRISYIISEGINKAIHANMDEAEIREMNY